MEANAMASHEIKLLSKIRQRRLRTDPRDHAQDVKKLCCAAKEWFVVRIKSNCFMTEKPTQVQKIARAAAEIQNLERRRAIEPKVLDALDVDADPVGCVFIGVYPSRIRPIRIALAQPL